MKNFIFGSLLFGLFFFVSCGGDSEDDLKGDCTNSSLQISEVSTTDADCTTDGSLEVSASDASGAVTFSLDGGASQSSGIFSVSAGTYTLTSTDAMGCTSSTDVTVGADATVTISDVSSSSSGCKMTNGTISVTASGGSGGLMYQLDEGSFQSSNSFSGVEAGSHNIVVKDGADCTANRSEQVLTGVSLANDIMPIMNANCTVSSSCHTSSAPRVDLSIPANVISKKGQVKSRTQSGGMPPGGRSITQTEKDAIACWVDDGALDN